MKVQFILNGCDISFYAEAPEDMTLKQLLKQCDRIKPDWCACGICSADFKNEQLELEITYDDVVKVDPDAPCTILSLEEVEDRRRRLNES